MKRLKLNRKEYVICCCRIKCCLRNCLRCIRNNNKLEEEDESQVDNEKNCILANDPKKFFTEQHDKISERQVYFYSYDIGWAVKGAYG